MKRREEKDSHRLSLSLEQVLQSPGAFLRFFQQGLTAEISHITQIEVEGTMSHGFIVE